MSRPSLVHFTFSKVPGDTFNISSREKKIENNNIPRNRRIMVGTDFTLLSLLIDALIRFYNNYMARALIYTYYMPYGMYIYVYYTYYIHYVCIYK